MVEEKVSQESLDRREKSNKIIHRLGIECYDELPVIQDSNSCELKSLDDIVRRAIAALFSIQLACDICSNNNYQESRDYFDGLLQDYHVKEYLLYKERLLFSGEYTLQDAIDVAWTYDAYWALCWGLGLINKMGFPSEICNVKVAIALLSTTKTYEQFKNKCHLRDKKEILDKLDLYFRYHWACEENRINDVCDIKNLNPEVVAERRRGLEWLVSPEKDWNDIRLDT